jgi:hypothetical protein
VKIYYRFQNGFIKKWRALSLAELNIWKRFLPVKINDRGNNIITLAIYCNSLLRSRAYWIPAYAGMTTLIHFVARETIVSPSYSFAAISMKTKISSGLMN